MFWEYCIWIEAIVNRRWNEIEIDTIDDILEFFYHLRFVDEIFETKHDINVSVFITPKRKHQTRTIKTSLKNYVICDKQRELIDIECVGGPFHTKIKMTQ